MFFQHALGLSLDYDRPQEWAVKTLRRCKGEPAAETWGLPVGLAMDQVRQVLQKWVPQMAQQLPVRVGPLREQWESRGPGLLHSIRNLTDENLLLDQARVILVQPVLGGFGAAHPEYNLIRIEAVLAHPVPELPEPIRMAWLLAQLRLDQARFRDDLHLSDSHRIGSLALIPVALFAAEQVEWANLNPATVALACQTWLPAGWCTPEEANTLWTWWETYLDHRPSWSVGMQALNHLLMQ